MMRTIEAIRIELRERAMMNRIVFICFRCCQHKNKRWANQYTCTDSLHPCALRRFRRNKTIEFHYVDLGIASLSESLELPAGYCIAFE